MPKCGGQVREMPKTGFPKGELKRLQISGVLLPVLITAVAAGQSRLELHCILMWGSSTGVTSTSVRLPDPNAPRGPPHESRVTGAGVAHGMV
jgi:hypothetical protein